MLEKVIKITEEKQQSVLVVCNNGQNRSLCLVICYLMKHFKWSLFKTLAFMDYKQSDLEIDTKVYKHLQKVG